MSTVDRNLVLAARKIRKSLLYLQAHDPGIEIPGRAASVGYYARVLGGRIKLGTVDRVNNGPPGFEPLDLWTGNLVDDRSYLLPGTKMAAVIKNACERSGLYGDGFWPDVDMWEYA